MESRRLLHRSETDHWPSLLSRTVLFGIGGLLTTVFFYDLLLELGNPAYPLWISLAESIPVLGFSVGILGIGVRMSTGVQDQISLSETARGCLVGFVSTLSLGFALILLREIRGGGAPMVYTLTSAGTFAGTLVGYYRAQDKRTRRELRSITEHVSEGIYRSTPKKGIVFANQAFADMFGFESTEALLEADPETLYADPETRTRLREQARTRGTFENKRISLRRRDGSTFTGRLSGTVVRDGNGDVKYYDGAVADITEQINREEALRRAKEKAEEASRLKSAFLANMSHEIRTPLTSIIGFAEAIGEEVSGTDGSVTRFADLIQQGGKRLLETLDAVLNLSKLEAGEMTLAREPVDLTQGAKAVVEELRPRAEEADVELSVEPPDSPVRAEADEGGVQIIAQNLVSNAIKYTDAGGEVRVRTRQEEGQALLEVEDTGIGMDPEMAEDLFKPFRQATEGTRRLYEGTGVGLAVTRQAVEQMRGSIEVETEKGEGSRFIVQLPGVDGNA